MHELGQLITMKNLSNFFLTYPALSWVMVHTEPEVRPYALIAGPRRGPLGIDFPGGYDWIDNADLSDAERATLALYTENKDIIRRLLDDFSEEDLKLLKPVNEGQLKWKSVYEFLYHAGLGNTGRKVNRPLVSYLLKRGFPPLYNTDIVKLGDMRMIRRLEKILNKNKTQLYVDREVIKSAIVSNNPEVLRYIMSIDPEAKEDYQRINTTYFERPAKKKNLEMVKALVETGAPMKVALVAAVEIPGKLDIAKYLISVGYSPFKTNYMPSAFATSMSNIEALEYFINRYGDEIPEADWWSALRNINDFDFTNKISVESLILLLESHPFTKEQLTKVYENHISYVKTQNDEFKSILLDAIAQQERGSDDDK